MSDPQIILAATLLALCAGDAAADEPQHDRLERLVRQDCGSCHGMRLSGGLGPDIRAAALAGRDNETLETIILDGIPGTPMPPWRPLLSAAEAAWIVGYLREVDRP
ncbi:cytochrome C556 [Maritimibacter sp. 55A14]|uniref:c-type cytochrome n=1 Tax=Maritimibacter sp. 55A14 TaxID=2174844 RepID=UPI000D62093E|nr:cytochrome c [Maritimibacter sp. 55A14]PWE34352.1 cytochrome C556 [Maritimibacter sp. 55A14]